MLLKWLKLIAQTRQTYRIYVFGKKTDEQLKLFMTMVYCSVCSLFYDFVAGRRQPMEKGGREEGGWNSQ
jgi:hypothetical protein